MDEFRTPPVWEEPDESEIRSRRPPRKRPEKDENALLYMQIVVSLVLILLLFVIKAVGGNFYSELRKMYESTFNDRTSADEILKVISRRIAGPDDDSSKTSSDPSSQPASSDTSSDAESDETESEDSEEDIIYPEDSEDSEAPSVPEGEEEGDASYVENVSEVTTKLNHDLVAMNTLLLPVSGRITSPYGYRVDPITGVFGMHHGLDLGADMNTPISAAEKGTVLSVSYSSSYGNYIILDHGNGLHTLYAHCGKITAKPGEEVQRGQTIAKVGTTGASTGPHLHFEVRIGGTRINPEWVLKRIERA